MIRRIVSHVNWQCTAIVGHLAEAVSNCDLSCRFHANHASRILGGDAQRSTIVNADRSREWVAQRKTESLVPGLMAERQRCFCDQVYRSRWTGPWGTVVRPGPKLREARMIMSTTLSVHERTRCCDDRSRTGGHGEDVSANSVGRSSV